jgi:hypothetical protein
MCSACCKCTKQTAAAAGSNRRSAGVCSTQQPAPQHTSQPSPTNSSPTFSGLPCFMAAAAAALLGSSGSFLKDMASRASALLRAASTVLASALPLAGAWPLRCLISSSRAIRRSTCRRAGPAEGQGGGRGAAGRGRRHRKVSARWWAVPAAADTHPSWRQTRELLSPTGASRPLG